jgi:hypothetical protein
MAMLLGERDHRAIDEKIFQACYVEWRDRQLARQVSDPFSFAYEATERELGRRKGWPAIHAATIGFFVGLFADVLLRWRRIEIDASPGHWVGSMPALVVGLVVYAVLVVMNRSWHQRLDYHVAMAIESNELKRRSAERA